MQEGVIIENIKKPDDRKSQRSPIGPGTISSSRKTLNYGQQTINDDHDDEDRMLSILREEKRKSLIPLSPALSCSTLKSPPSCQDSSEIEADTSCDSSVSESEQYTSNWEEERDLSDTVTLRPVEVKLEKLTSIEPVSPVEAKKSRVRKNTGMDIQCPTCGDRKSKQTFMNHLLTHYAKIFTPMLPSTSPYTCPECPYRSRDKVSLMRHYAFTHEKIFEMTELTKEGLKEIRIRALVHTEEVIE